MICTAEGCERKANCAGRTLCIMHYKRQKRNGHTKRTVREKGAGYLTIKGYVWLEKNGIAKFEHVWIAEKALGRFLPFGAQVHHIDGNRSNNNPSNLVICPSAAYHKLLHKRQRELGYDI